MKKGNILKKANDLVAASSVTDCHKQPDHTQLGKQQKLWMKEGPGLCPERYHS